MIETQRLYLLPLRYDQLHKYILNDGSLEEELGLHRHKRIIPAELKEALKQDVLPKTASEKYNYIYCTLWTIIWKEERVMTGDFCFTGEPDETGTIETGYGIYEEFQGKGFMTEALEGIISWSKKQAEIKTIMAYTNKENIASYSVLQKNGFIKTTETESLYNWKLKIRE